MSPSGILVQKVAAMPIRFRCGRCHQLMGIARRKAGMTVHCPTCHHPVIVPREEAVASPPQPSVPQPMGEASPPLFERSDFEAFLFHPQPEPPKAVEPPPPPPDLFSAEQASAPSLALAASPPRARPAGLLLSPTQATWLTVLVILLVALAFGAGLLVGYYVLG